MSKQQTAVNWLIQTLESDIKVDESNMFTIRIHEHDYFKSKQVALEMEKEQIINTFKDAQVFKVMNDETRAEQYYYNKTYNNET